MTKKQQAPLTMWFKDIHKEDIALVGGKGANLGELVNAGIPVPNGFCVTAQAYYYFIEKTGIKAKIAKELKGLNADDNKRLNAVAREIKRTIVTAKMPEDLVKQIKDAYHKLGGFPVAVRSSATAEDLPDASFAGQQTTYLNVTTPDEVVKSVKNCYASLFEARAIYYRVVQKYDHLKVGLSAPVQNLINSDVAGILFTVDPVEENPDYLIIEAGWGLGEAIVLGEVTPDRYVIDKKNLSIVSKEINEQKWKVAKKGEHGDQHMAVPKSKQKVQKISDETILKLAEIGLKIEKHYGKPQDTEWAIEDGKIYFVQSRPITTLGKKKAHKDSQTDQQREDTATDESKAEVILKGAAASLGMASGPVKIIHKPTEIDKINDGDVLVTEMTTPDFVPAMRKARAIVTDTGGRTCHAAIVSRELGIPCVVGTGTATHVLKNGQVITVDGAKGLVFKGKIQTKTQTGKDNILATGPAGSGSMISEEIPVTGTKVYVNLGEPSLAEEVAKLPVDGVGLLRAEFMVASLGEHPKAMVASGRGDKYVDALVEGLKTIAGAFNPRPVVYRATDFKTNEYRGLKGGDKYEPVEDNPMIGYRGASRYIADPDMFAYELKAIKKVREELDLKNLHMMVPFVRTVDEMKQCMELIKAGGLSQGPDFKILMMCEIPANVILLEKFIALGIDGVSIGSNDLTQLTLGVDRDNQTLAATFDERDEAVTMSIEYVIKTCRRLNVTCSICGQAPSTYPEITEMMVRAGTTSVSVTPDIVIATKKLIASVEKRLLLNKIIDR
ncbi:phosphoenolpyruvate synthase [Candidatus Berkelbacteria bacterium CG10_big_fil_rev_8_21_14_0_10_43_13]|uniref:Phosphoenolpyruvate synthase n=1 Tax=Candidatus Berkelbacteria bacterium CG10_big_fil_rev_8_21_14_0_10_43_13 TaxID=1974514 RepID=A0A2H0W5F0_9BACT|nr:MAG: phosphoenolpyruvate synthase [Candidatus Berkelbacteria bacterium CG10_big_fil_rev_8_21_14_0_10_43_13]